MLPVPTRPRYAFPPGSAMSTRRLHNLSVQVGPTAAAPLLSSAGATQREDRVAYFRRHGFVFLPGLLSPEQVSRLQAQFSRDVPTPAPGARFVDIPRAVEADDVYLDLLESEDVVQLLQQVIGSDAHCIQVQARTVYPSNEGAYTGWHRDYERGASDLRTHGHFDHPALSTSVKLFVAVADTDASMGCTCIVPDTFRGQGNPPKELATEDMPGMLRFTSKAGDAMLMDFRTWHAASPNTSVSPRQSLILQFAASKWQQTGSLISSAQRLLQRRGSELETRPILRQMLGLGVTDRLADTAPPPPDSSVGPWPLLPAPPLPTPATALELQVGHFREHGFAMLPGLMSGAVLSQLQRDFHREQGRILLQQGPAGMGPDGYFDLPQSTILDTSESYQHLLQEPRLVSLLDAVVGEDVKCVEIGARTVLPSPVRSNPKGEAAEGESYTSWHRDYGREGLGQQWNWCFDHPTLSEDVKLFLCVSDTTGDQAPTAIVPGTHRLLAKPPDSWANKRSRLAEMPLRIQLTGRAGDAMLADIRTWHTAMANTSTRPRESLILMFSPFWRKGREEFQQFGKRVRRERGDGALSPRLAQMLGVELMRGGGNIYDPDWLAANSRPDLM